MSPPFCLNIKTREMIAAFFGCLLANIVTLALIVGIVIFIYRKYKGALSEKFGILDNLKRFLDRFLSGIE